MRIGTRASALALAQAHGVAAALAALDAAPLDCQVVPIVTSGDRGAVSDKSRWVAELEQALARGEIDLAVHSAKDLPGELGEGLSVFGAPPRAAAEDVLCGVDSLDALGAGASVGTSSVRRLAQLHCAREDLEVVEMRGNVDTRLRKLANPNGTPHVQAIVLARAGLQRLGRESDIGAVLDPKRFVPAPGQGALALQGRDGDMRTREAAAAISEPHTLACLLAERSLARELCATCHTPLGAHAERAQDDAEHIAGEDERSEGDAAGARLRLRAWVGLPDGSAWIRDELDGEDSQPALLGRLLAARLKLAGAQEMLRRAEEMASVGNA